MEIRYDTETCDGCGTCAKVCPQQILAVEDKVVQVLDLPRCMGCFGCEDECHTSAIRVIRTAGADDEPAFEPTPAATGPFDVVVIGGGPAGLGAALQCAREGRSVCLCERLPHRHIAHHADGGVMLSMPGLPQIEQDGEVVQIPDLDIRLPPSLKALEIDRLGIIGPQGLATGDAFPKNVPKGLMSNKERFTATLADLAEQAGATLRYGARVVDYLRDGDAFAGVVLHDGTEIPARVVVVAEGIQGRLSKKAGLPSRKGISAHAVVLAYEYELRPGVPHGLFYMDGDLQLEPDMPPAMAGVGVTDHIEVLLVLLFKKRFYKAPKPMDHYLDIFVAQDQRVKDLLGDALDGQQPRRLNGCRAVFHPTNRDIVRDGLVSIGDAFVGGGELGNIPALAHGVHTGKVIGRALADDDASAAALGPVADFITDDLAKVTEINGRIKSLPMHLTEEELTEYFQVMKDANYPTLLFGGPAQQGLMFTRLMAKNAFRFLRKPKLLKWMQGKT